MAKKIEEKVTKSENNVPKVEIEIKRHQQLFELLSNPNRMWRVLLSLFLIIVVFFWGIAFVVIAIKKYYPYNVIETNIYGATTMKTEDKEVIYWLFNTADLWANSGIDVKKGDVLTIRASGASFTAIHHLVDASEKNYRPTDKWVGTEGQSEKRNNRDKERVNFRINKNYNEGILLMQIIPNDESNSANDWMENHCSYLKNGHIEIIGKERRDLRISHDGELHFAVNDIVLTNDVINDMYKEWIESVMKDSIEVNCTRQKIASFLKISIDSIMRLISPEDIDTSTINTLKEINNKYFNDSLPKLIENRNIGLALGRYPRKYWDKDAEKEVTDSDYYLAYPLVNELIYYKQKKFYDAWYVDNLGSFLIVIERTK